jgi:predicted metal-dependent phosphoesterase TrpH
MKYANLHLHSTYSDAQFTPAQLCLIGKSLGYRAMALTDHETDGGVKELMAYASKQGGVDVIAGCEFYGKYDGALLHLTALDYDMENPKLRAFIQERVDQRNECTRKCVERGIRLGYVEGITWDDIVSHHGELTWLCIDSIYNTYRVKRIPIPDHFRENVINAPEAKAFRPQPPTAEEVIRVVREAGGIIALAHPYQQTHYIPALVKMGLNGVEVSHPDNYENTSALAIEAAKTYHLYHCGGTDHTGPMSGCSGNCAIPAFQGVTEEEYYILKERRLG